MRRVILAVVVVYSFSLSSLTYAQTIKPVETISLSQIHAGMKGTAYTVFQGTKPEPMDVEVLGVLKNANGPKGDIILVRLGGAKAEYTGVVAGMSGSPVYFNGKLAGAVAFRIGEFSKEPIAGVTPIAEMLEISALDRTPTGTPFQAKSAPSMTAKTSGPGVPEAVSSSANRQEFAHYLKPIESPLVFSGFSEDAVQKFAPQFASQGVVPVMGVGSASDVKQADPLVPGSAVSAVLVRGDMNIAATCTVTYIDSGHLLACGHPLMQFGMIALPMTKTEVLATVPSPLNAFKIVNSTETVGAFVQDRHTGIMGEFGKQPEMIPVTLTIHGTTTKNFHYEILNNARLSPMAISTTVYNALHGVNEYGEEITYTMKGNIAVHGFPEVKLQDMFSSPDGMQPAAMLAAASIGNSFGKIYDNPYSTPDITGLHLDFEVTSERRWARLESARTDFSEARPGDEIMVEVLLRPYRGDAVIEHILVRVPASAAKGSTLHVLVSDGEVLDRVHRGNASTAQSLDLASTIGVLNKQHANNRVYVSVLNEDPEAMVEDKVMPALPLSVMNVMDGTHGTQDMTVLGESSVSETATGPLDFVVSGAQLLLITIK